MPEAINFSTGVSSAWTNVATFVPKFVVFLIIMIVGYLVAKVIAKILSRVLTRVGFDRLVERGGVKAALDRSKFDASDIMAKLVYYAIMLFVLSTAFGVFGSNPVSDYLRAVIAYLPLVFVAIVIVVIAALDQLHIAQNVVNAILYAALAAIVGIAIVAIGGGGIRTMSQRWEAAAARYDEEKPRIAAAARTAPPLSEQARSYTTDQTRLSASGRHGTASQP